ncbi:hypothetical protein BDY17DRAFT_325291 [Neohortaea acidophila]|uniref:Uncharacterized protein n=1 Tax=Neohortaea acidophila TaxID=245834 RepID=A0A6A6PRD7_9PEZI|nr:uncharacterized protein BDY17DRAFT_325291 [Neohortaea acidophila]KAF2481777.1 hypothetical protein BDY17DRAFT_325291 [Neohortaea acidophila]
MPLQRIWRPWTARRFVTPPRSRSTQRRTFLGLQRGPPQSQATNAYLVGQGLIIVLLVDLAIATAMQDKTTFRSICQAAGWWQDPPHFQEAHGSGDASAEGEN